MGKKETRERIFQAALAIFSKKGYSATTTREIAAHAGVTEVTLFRHFGTKEYLFQEAILRFSPASILTDELDEKLTGDLHHDLKLLAKRYLTNAMENVEQIRIGVMEAPRNPELARAVCQIPIRLTSHLAAHLEEISKKGEMPEQNFKLKAQMFYNVLFQNVFSACTVPAIRFDFDEEEFIETLVSLFVNGLTGTEKDEV
ncbi:MAG TPA: TetR/AcrR family transcriptional regulator [Bacillales bacterium]